MLPAVKRLFLLLLLSLTVFALGFLFKRQEWRGAEVLLGTGGAVALGCVVTLVARQAGRPAKRPMD